MMNDAYFFSADVRLVIKVQMEKRSAVVSVHHAWLHGQYPLQHLSLLARRSSVVICAVSALGR